MSGYKLLKLAIHQLKLSLQLKSCIYKASCILLGGGQISELLNQKQWVINGTIRVSQTHSYLQSRQSCQWAWKYMSSQVLCPHWWWHCQWNHLLQVQGSPPALSVLCFNGHGQHCPLQYSFAIGRTNLHFSVLQNISFILTQKPFLSL